MMTNVYIGTAAWTLPKEHRAEFAERGSHLERYSSQFNAVEINTSFYRDHQRKTYERWAASVPDKFRFSVKLSKIFTHEQKLKDGEKSLRENLEAIQGLGAKLGCVLIQLPPKLEFDPAVAEQFFSSLRELYSGDVALEPRHASWEHGAARSVLRDFKISRVLADPQPYLLQPLSDRDFAGIAYLRLHGSPEIYKSAYDEKRLRIYAEMIRDFQQRDLKAWCIFDNTTFGHSTKNAFDLGRLLEQFGDSVGQKFARGSRDMKAVGNQF